MMDIYMNQLKIHFLIGQIEGCKYTEVIEINAHNKLSKNLSLDVKIMSKLFLF